MSEDPASEPLLFFISTIINGARATNVDDVVNFDALVIRVI